MNNVKDVRDLKVGELIYYNNKIKKDAIKILTRNMMDSYVWEFIANKEMDNSKIDSDILENRFMELWDARQYTSDELNQLFNLIQNPDSVNFRDIRNGIDRIEEFTPKMIDVLCKVIELSYELAYNNIENLGEF